MTKSNNTWMRRSADWLLLDDGTTIPAPGDSGDGYLADWGMPVWEDTFQGVNGSAPDAAKWYRRGLPGSDYYLTNTDRQGIIQRDNAYVENGNLILKTERRSSPLTPDAYTRWYDTAYIDTMPRGGFAGFEQRYGRWEARVHSLDTGNTAGIWSAFWLRTNQDGGEIDVFEHVGTPAGRDENGGTSGSWPYAGRWPGSGAGAQAVFFEETGRTSGNAGEAYYENQYLMPTPPGGFPGWHTYACEWTPNRITTYIDGLKTGEIVRGVRPRKFSAPGVLGNLTATTDTPERILDGGFGGSAKMHMRLDVHVGFPGNGMASETYTQSPHYFRVDYVRVWEWNGQE